MFGRQSVRSPNSMVQERTGETSKRRYFSGHLIHFHRVCFKDGNPQTVCDKGRQQQYEDQKRTKAPPLRPTKEENRRYKNEYGQRRKAGEKDTQTIDVGTGGASKREVTTVSTRYDNRGRVKKNRKKITSGVRNIRGTSLKVCCWPLFS